MLPLSLSLLLLLSISWGIVVMFTFVMKKLITFTLFSLKQQIEFDTLGGESTDYRVT